MAIRYVLRRAASHADVKSRTIMGPFAIAHQSVPKFMSRGILQLGVDHFSALILPEETDRGVNAHRLSVSIVNFSHTHQV
jgi:hypothetical protein